MKQGGKMQTGEKIKKIRKSKMLTQKELGELCGIAGSTIRRYENGGLNPKLETIKKIAAALEVPYTDLLDDESNHSNNKQTEEEYFVITEQACMQLALQDFGINVSIRMADAIKQTFMDLMIGAGHIGVKEDVD